MLVFLFCFSSVGARPRTVPRLIEPHLVRIEYLKIRGGFAGASGHRIQFMESSAGVESELSS